MIGIMTINSDLNPAETLVKEAIRQAREFNAAKNKKDRQKIVDFYMGRQNRDEYLRDYGFKDQDEFPLSTINITKKIIDKISLVYKNQPDRWLDNGQENMDQQTDVYQDFLNKHKKIHTGIKEAERLKNALHQILFRPMWYDGEWRAWIETEWTPIFKEGNPLEPIAYLIPVKRDTNQTELGKIEDRDWFMYWSKDYYYWVDDDGNVKFDPEFPDGKNPFGRLPFIEMRKQIAIDDYWLEGAIDLVEMNQQINVLINDLNLSIRFQSYDQPYITGVSLKEAENIKFGPNKVISAEHSDASLGLLGYNPKLTEVVKVIQDLINVIGWTYNVHINWSMQGSPASGFSLLVQNIDLLESREDDVELCKMYEDEIYNIIQKQTKVLKTDTKALPELSDKLQLKVDFNEIDFPINEAEKRDADDWDIAHNIKSEIDLIQERNPDMSEDQAADKWNKNKQLNAKYSGRQQALRDRLTQEGVQVINEPATNSPQPG